MVKPIGETFGYPKWLERAVGIATTSSYDKWRIGAVVVKGGAVQSSGVNSLKIDPLYLDDHSNCSIHAEIAALKTMRDNHLQYKAKGCTIYVARLLRGGGIGLAKPCGNCQEILSYASIKQAIFTIDNHTHGVWKP